MPGTVNGRISVVEQALPSHPLRSDVGTLKGVHLDREMDMC